MKVTFQFCDSTVGIFLYMYGFHGSQQWNVENVDWACLEYVIYAVQNQGQDQRGAVGGGGGAKNRKEKEDTTDFDDVIIQVHFQVAVCRLYQLASQVLNRSIWNTGTAGWVRLALQVLK